MTIFEKICTKQIPAKIVLEDDLCVAFHDINPQAPVHVLLVPRKPIARLMEAKEEDRELLGHLLLKAQEVAKQMGLVEGGFRVVINNGRNAGESVPHLHVHVLGGRPMSWPPG